MNVATTSVAETAAAAQIVLNTIRRPVIMVDPGGLIAYANADAEDFFRSSASVLAKKTLAHFVPFGSPILTLVGQVRERRAPVNEYRVDISSPRIGVRRPRIGVRAKSSTPPIVMASGAPNSSTKAVPRPPSSRKSARLTRVIFRLASIST